MIKPLIASTHNLSEAATHTANHTAHQVAEHGGGDLIAYILHSNVINIILVACFIVWLIKKVDVATKIKNKKEEITQVILASEEEKILSEQELKDAKKHVKNLDKEVRNVLLEAKTSAEAMYEKIKSDTKNRADEIQSSLEKMIESEKKSASGEISSHITKKAFDLAEQQIKDSLTEEMHNKHINNFIDSLDEKKVN